MNERIKAQIYRWEEYGLREVHAHFPQLTFLECGFLWQEFSDDMYCAGFIAVDAYRIKSFKEWLELDSE